MTVLAFDVYGTLIDPFGISQRLKSIAGDKTPAFAQMWRDKQIEYLFRRGLGRDYRPFSICTSQALDYTALQLQVELPAGDKQELMPAAATMLFLMASRTISPACWLTPNWILPWTGLSAFTRYKASNRILPCTTTSCSKPAPLAKKPGSCPATLSTSSVRVLPAGARRG
jgi:hypothetical protein